MKKMKIRYKPTPEDIRREWEGRPRTVRETVKGYVVKRSLGQRIVERSFWQRILDWMK